jgi:hypothetical protein
MAVLGSREKRSILCCWTYTSRANRREQMMTCVVRRRHDETGGHEHTMASAASPGPWREPGDDLGCGGEAYIDRQAEVHNGTSISGITRPMERSQVVFHMIEPPLSGCLQPCIE